MEVTEAGMWMEVIAVDWNAALPISSHPSPSSVSLGEPAASHMALVKILSAGDVPAVYSMVVMSKETCYTI